MSKILITGAAGFIGSQLAHRLHQNGEQVVLVDNFSYGSEDNLIFEDCDFRDSIHREDIRDRAFMEALMEKEKFDEIYHIAAITPLPDCQNNPTEAVDVNVRGTVLILELARKYGVKKVYFASTSAVYENNSDFPSREEHVEYPGLIYPSTKFAAEQFCRAFSTAYGIPVVVFRFANVYGPHIDCLRTTPPVMGYLIREFYKGNSPILHSTGKQERDFIFVEDLIDLALAVRSAEHFDIVNVSTETTVSINAIAELIAKEMDCEDIPLQYAEVAHFWAKYPELYEKPYPISEEMLAHEVLKYTCLSTEHARTYGWAPKTDLKEGVRKTVEFSVDVLRKAGIPERKH